MATKPKTNGTSIHALAAASRQVVQEAEVALTQRLTTHEDTASQRVELLARAATDDAVTPEELTTADAAIVLAEQRVAGARAALLKAQRGLVNEETHLADILVATVASALPGVSVTVTSLAPSEAPSDLPAVVIVQPKPSVQDYVGGTISGEAQILYFRTPLHTELAAASLEQGAVERCLFGSFRSIGSDPRSGAADTVQASITHASPEMPVLPVTADGSDDWRWGYLRQVIEGMVRQQSMRLQPSPYPAAVPYRATGSAILRVLADETGDGGRRTRRVDLSLGLNTTESYGIDCDMLETVGRRVFSALVGQHADGLGRILSAEVRKADMGPPNRANHYTVHGEFTVVSQVHEPQNV